MKQQYKHLRFIAGLMFLLLQGIWQTAGAQTAPPGVQFILVSFDQPPTSVTVEKTPLRYNKKFAVSFHNDDGIEDIYSVGFPYFTGINNGSTNYPGLFYTDGCGNPISFKLSSNLYSWNANNDEDMHFPGNGYNVVTWPELAVMYQNNCGIYNHGFTSDAFTDDPFMNYSIRRNESYIRRQLIDVTPGGVRTRIFVNPNGASAYTQVAFDNGYKTAFLQSGGLVGDFGVDVTSFNAWDQNLALNRLIAENIDLQAIVDQNANAEGAWWVPLFTHSIVQQYPLADFLSDFAYIANTYGSSGADNVWVASEQEILDYLRVNQLTTVTSGVAGTTMLIQLSGNIPTDQRWYPLSLVVEATGATITNIQINGGTNNTFTGVGESNALINLEWDGYEVPDMVALADSYVTTAEQTQTQYDCSIAMDYVLMLPQGTDQQELKNRLCAIQGVTYEEGFCETCDFTLGDTQMICQGECVTLSAPEGEGNVYLWSNDSTTQSITVCPDVSTLYWAQLTTPGGCEAYAEVQIDVMEAAVFDLGPDLDVCIGDTVYFETPLSDTYTYAWYLDGVLNAETGNILTLPVTDTVQVVAEVLASSGCLSADTVMVYAQIVPLVELGENLEACQGDTLYFDGPEGDGFFYLWYVDGVLQGNNTPSFAYPVFDTALIKLQVETDGGCSDADSLFVFALETPEFDLPTDIQVCTGDSLYIEAPTGSGYSYAWYVDNNLINQTGPVMGWLVSDTVMIKLSVLASTGCIASDSMLVFALDVPVINVSPDMAEICFGNSIDLSLTATGADGFEWWNGSTSQSLTFTPTVSDTTYKLWAEAVNGYGCTAADTAFVSVYTVPQILLQIDAGSSQLCAGDELRLSVESSNGTLPEYVVWNNTDTVYFGNQSVVFNTFVPAQNGWIKAEIAIPSGCSDADSLFVTVFNRPEITISADMQACIGETLQLEASGGLNCTWYDANGIVGQGYTYEFDPTEPATYTFYAVVENGSPLFCSQTDSVVVVVHDTPVVTVNASSQNVCSGSNVVLTANGGENYTWPGFTETGNLIEVQPTDTTTYEVIATSEFGCADTARITINVFPVTPVTISGLLPVYCLNDSPSQLTGTPEGGYFTGPGMVAGAFNPALAGDGVHVITYNYGNEFECSSSDSLVTRVFGGTTSIDLGNDTLICPNQAFVLDAGEGFSQYFWSTGETTQSILVSGFSYLPGTTHQISVVGNKEGCTAAGSMTVEIRDDCFIGIGEGAAKDHLHISPNPNNGVFSLQLPENTEIYKLELFDLQGRACMPALINPDCDAAGGCTFSVPDPQSGVYILRLTTNKGMMAARLLIQ